MAKKKSGGTVVATAKVQPIVRVQPHYRDTDSGDSGGAGYHQWLSSLQQQLDNVQSGRILRVDLSTGASRAASPIPSIPRYTVTVVDHSLPATATATAASSDLSCGVLILSQGREHDWLFSHSEGQHSLCRQHSFHRLLLVTLNRGHTFTSLQHVQDEIRESVSSLLPAKERRGAVPFLALSADIGGRREVAVLPTDANGEVIVEDVREPDGAWIRRLLFVDIGMVQSEARLVRGSSSKGNSSHTPPPLSSPIDFAHLPSGYHQSFLAALSLLPSPPSSVLLVGVGAGSLAMFLSCVLPLCSLTLVELDGAILRVAEAYFGFHSSDRMTVRIMDGVEYITAAAASDAAHGGMYDVVCVDCNSGDLSEGLSFPPPTFLSPAVLSATHSLCRPSSLYLLNFGCRSASTRQAVLLSLLECWDELYEVDVGEADTTNTVLAARRVERLEQSDMTAPLTLSACQSRLVDKRRVAEWRQWAREQGEQLRPFEWDEQMDLTDKCSSIQRISRQRATQHRDETKEGKDGDKDGAGESAAERGEVITQPLPPGEDEGGESEAEVESDEKSGGVELSVEERKRAKVRAKRARQKAAKAKGR